MPKSSAPRPAGKLTYEQAVEELESIISMLEGGQRPLDEAMLLYERAQTLVKRCTEMLDKAELKVKQLSEGQLSDFEEN